MNAPSNSSASPLEASQPRSVNEKSAETPASFAADPETQLQKFLQAVHVMKLYASAGGIPIPEGTRARLVAIVEVEAAVTESVKNKTRLVLPPDTSLAKALDLAIEAHTAMSKVVAPATPDSIAYTAPPSGIVDFAMRQPIIALLAGLAFFSISGFIILMIWAGVRVELSVQATAVLERASSFQSHVESLNDLLEDRDNVSEVLQQRYTDLERDSRELSDAAAALPDRFRTPWPDDAVETALLTLREHPVEDPVGPVAIIHRGLQQFQRELAVKSRDSGFWPVFLQHMKNLFAAMLGAVFYTLYTANAYIVQRTFDRAYTTSYVVRFVLGVVSGVILANFGEYMLDGSLSSAIDTPGIVLAQSLLALVGGYSADAVNVIFTRVAETLTTLVRGDSGRQVKAEAEAEAKADEAEASLDTAKAKQAELARLQELLAEVSSPDGGKLNIAARLKAQIKELTKKLEE